MNTIIISSKGLASVACYDPYFKRASETIIRSLADGKPVMIRLHSAAAYPSSDEVMRKNDLEGQAVLIVGYDNKTKMFALQDPWRREWGGNRSGIWWIKASQLLIEIVDCTLDFLIIPSALHITSKLQKTFDQKVSINVRVGFYKPDGIVMDQDNQVITSITAKIEGNNKFSIRGNNVISVEGEWHVGQTANIEFPISKWDHSLSEIEVSLEAIIGSKRPYAFEDKNTLRVRCPLIIDLQQKREITIYNENYSEAT